MNTLEYSKRLGKISPEQFQAALDRFDLGGFVRAEPIPFGLFGRNVCLSSTKGEYVLRRDPHFLWQFPTECFFAEQLHKRTQVPVPWPYVIEQSMVIFGWSYAIMPRLTGLQLADPRVKYTLGEEDKRGIARAMGENLAHMQTLTWPISGRCDMKTGTIQPFELAHELAWPFPVQNGVQASSHLPSTISYSERIVEQIRCNLARSRDYNHHTTTSDVTWVEELIAQAQSAFESAFLACFVMQDYKEHNVVVESINGIWHVSGVFDLMEADLSRTVAMYLDENPMLAREFVQAYKETKSLRPGFTERFPIYKLHDRLIIWEYFQRNGNVPWNENGTFRDWSSRYISCLADISLRHD